MNKDQFFNRHQHSQIHEAELERKWRLFQEQQQQEQWLLEAAAAAAGSASSVGGAGGGGTSYPQALVKNGQTITNSWTSQDLPNIMFVTTSANGADGKVTFADSGITSGDSSIFGNTFIENGGSFWFGNFDDPIDNITKQWFCLIDGDGNLVLTDKSEGNYTWDTNKFETKIVAWQYGINNDAQIKYNTWDGFNVNTYIFENTDGAIGEGWFGGWDESADGTVALYNYDPITDGVDKYLARTNGDLINVTSKLILPDGREPFNTYMNIGSNSIASEYYNGTVYDRLRILKTDGTLALDLDLTDFSVANNLDRYETDFGYVFVLLPDVTTTDLVFLFWDETNNSYEIVNAGPNQNWPGWNIATTRTQGPFDYKDSPEGSNNAYVVLNGAATFDDKMNRYDALTIYSKFAGSPVVEFENPSPSFAFVQFEKCAVPTFLCQEDGNIRLQTLVFDDNGWELSDTESAYEFITDYQDIRGMGKYSLLMWNDTGHASANERGFVVMEKDIVVDSLWIWTDNAWDTNYDTAFVRDNETNLMHYFTPAAGEWFTGAAGSAWTSYWVSDDITPGRDFGYVGNHEFGTTYFLISGDSVAVLTRDTVGNLDTWAPSGNPEAQFVANKHIIVLQTDIVEGDTVFQIIYVDTTGTVVNTVNTHNDTYADFRVISERCQFIQGTGDGDLHVFSITPTGYTEKTFIGTLGQSYTNDDRYRD